MKKKILRTIEYTLCAVMAASLLTGCEIIPTVNLTSDQNEQISEYAAGLLMTYIKGHPNGMVPMDKNDPALQPPEEEKSDEAESEEELSEDTSDENVEDVSNEPADENSEIAEDVSEEAGEEETYAVDPTYVENPLAPLEQSLGLEGVTVQYTGYEFTHEYPPADSDELTFSLQSAPGKKLLVVHFEVTNPGTDTITVSNVIADKKVRAIANGGQKIRAQKTILLNDLDSFSETMDPGVSEDTVIVFEVNEDVDENLSSLDISVISPLGTNTYSMI